MDGLLLTARVLLAAVFGVAGVAKLADLPGSRRAIAEFGLPDRLVAPLGLALPLAELAIAALLLPVATVWWGAVAALALLLAFIAGIAINLARGRTPECHCFGQLHSAPVGWSTLLRNVALAAVASFVVWQARTDPGPSLLRLTADLSTAALVAVIGGLVLVVIVAVDAWFLVHLLRQNGRLLLRVEALEAQLSGAGASLAAGSPTAGLPVGAPAPPFRVNALSGGTLTLDALRANRKPVMLLFTDPACGPCSALLPEVARWQRDYVSSLRIAIVSRGGAEANARRSAEHGLSDVLLQRDREVAEVYRVAGTPAALVVRADGTIGSPVAAGADAIRALVRRTTAMPAPPAGIAPDAGKPSQSAVRPVGTSDDCGCGKGNGSSIGNARRSEGAAASQARIGEMAPDFSLPDLAGRTLSLAGMRGSPAVVLFWSPRCGFCQRMLPELKSWEAQPPAEAPRLLVVSSGTAAENREMGLRSPIVLDQEFAVGRSFGAGGTPSAVLVSAAGEILSPVAVGAPAVLELLTAAGQPA